MRRPTLTTALGATATLLTFLGLALPWYHFSTSSGNQAPPGEPPIVERHATEVSAFRVESTDAVSAETLAAARVLGAVVLAAALGLVVLTLLDRRFDDVEGWRRPQLTIAWADLTLLLFALAWAVVRFPLVTGSPGLVAHATKGDGYVTGYPLAGVYLAGAAIVPLLALAALRYASGSLEWHKAAHASS